jgi:hypothetical protein
MELEVAHAIFRVYLLSEEFKIFTRRGRLGSNAVFSNNKTALEPSAIH